VILSTRFSDGNAKIDESALVDAAGFLAGIFERDTVRISCRPPSAAKSALDSLYGRFDLAQGRVVAGTTPPPGPGALLEVLSGP
jgi:hypothetical protein